MKYNKEVFNFYFDFDNVDFFKKLPMGNEWGTDNEKCQFYQFKYLQDKSESHFIKLWYLFTNLCKRAIKKEMKIKRFFLDYDELNYKADIACEYVLRRYKTYAIKGEKYKIENFISAARDGVIHALYSDKENDFYFEMCKSLNGKPFKEVSKRNGSFLLQERSGECLKTKKKDSLGQKLLFDF